MILSGKTIKMLNIMSPFNERTRYKGMTYGVGPAGYDVRVEFDSTGEKDGLTVFPGDFILASTIEKFTMPDDVVGIVHDKSTWARLGIACQNTVIEPGWRGYLTLEISNHGKQPVTIYRLMPIAQVIFHYVDQDTVGYEGKYQDQRRGPVRPIIEPCP